MNRLFSTAFLTLLSSVALEAQSDVAVPRLVVSITVDQLRTNRVQQFNPSFGADGFRRLLQRGRVYFQASYPFESLDRSSAVAALQTGTTPYYNGIPANVWLDRKDLQRVYSTIDADKQATPTRLLASTIGDEMKLQTEGKAYVYGIAEEQDAAVLSAGHAADGAFWLNKRTGKWTTSSFYPAKASSWIASFNTLYTNSKYRISNDEVCNLAIQCVNYNLLGRDDTPDLLSVTFSAKSPQAGDTHTSLQTVYTNLDRNIGRMMTKIEEVVGAGRVLFVLTGTGYEDEQTADYAKYHIPTGKLSINRTADLLNMYLGALYGTGKYVEAVYNNQIYLDRQLIERQRLNFNEVRSSAKTFLLDLTGITGVKDSPFSPNISGDILVEISPGWTLTNENTNESYTSRLNALAFPIIFYGAGIKASFEPTYASTTAIASTICNAIHIRAPNATREKPLF